MARLSIEMGHYPGELGRFPSKVAHSSSGIGNLQSRMAGSPSKPGSSGIRMEAIPIPLRESCFRGGAFPAQRETPPNPVAASPLPLPVNPIFSGKSSRRLQGSRNRSGGYEIRSDHGLNSFPRCARHCGQIIAAQATEERAYTAYTVFFNLDADLV